ncbi:MAG: tRNA lysidine(34) synthetase TilS [Phenylobacterium sp.]|uniref:tRNA lysidine(34) synthetase TilS n=1 Tax=Phenylobacterium sp. TaxID=1871053 RepID=UPI0025DCA5E7|nr:tRNA lysidine(34) synthetase TilS [Phenylobacterium sp.]MCG9917602.1 tRNA lysidine(34) synthetase TilS [Phenylobacterium sp.]
MRLTPESAPSAVHAAAAAHFEARLSKASPAPLAVAFSGGGDSLALLLIAQAWSQSHGRRLIVLHVDHGLQSMAKAWARHCQAVAERLGLPFEGLTWTGDKPDQGLPAAARDARHRLLAQAARRHGARVLLMGHTADDGLEAQQMRQDGATTSEPRIWSPSPAWPEGRDLFLLRPLLTTRRAALRAMLEQQPLSWIEDPANENLTFARARARAKLAEAPPRPASPPPSAEQDLAPLGQLARHHWAGLLSWDRGPLQTAHRAPLARLLSIACLCAGGGTSPPRRDALDRLADQVAGPDPFTATLAGARIEADSQAITILREAGEAARGGLGEIALCASAPTLWDGRFVVTTTGSGERIGALAGRMGRLSSLDRRLVQALVPAARRALPVVINANDQVCLQPERGEIRSLVQARFEAAAGLVTREPDAGT